MKLEAGKKYVLRNGRVEKCLAVWCEEVRGYQATVTYRPHGGTEYTIDGKWQCGGEESPFDIVAEYKEPKKYCVKVHLWSDGTLWQDSDGLVAVNSDGPFHVETREIEWEVPDTDLSRSDDSDNKGGSRG